MMLNDVHHVPWRNEVGDGDLFRWQGVHFRWLEAKLWNVFQETLLSYRREHPFPPNITISWEPLLRISSLAPGHEE